MDKLSGNLSERKTLYEEMIRLYEQQKDEVIKVRNIKKIDQDFEEITGITRSVLCFIKKGRSRPKLSTLITFCISLMLDTIDSYALIELAGYKLSQNYEVDRAYAELLQYHNHGDLKECNKYLGSLGIEKQYLLGVKSRTSNKRRA